MTTQVDPGHNLVALLLGTGEFSFSLGATSAANARARGYVDFGNIVALTPSTEPTKEEHFGSYRGVRRKDRTLITETKLEYQIRADEWNRLNLEILFGASSITGHTQSALTAVAGEVLAFATTAGVKGRWYEIRTAGGARLRRLTDLEFGAAAAVAGPGLNAGDLISDVAHGLVNGQRVIFTGTGLAAPLVAGTVYYVVNKTDDNFQVALTSGGAAIVISADSTDQSYTLLMEPVTDFDADLKLARVKFNSAQSADKTPLITCPAIVAGDPDAMFNYTPLGDPVKSGYGRLVICDQDDDNNVVIDHKDFSCDISIESTSEVDGQGFTDMTINVAVTDDVGELSVRDANENDGLQV